LAETLGARRLLWQILAELSTVEALQGPLADAESLRQQARAVVTAIAERTATPELRRAFLNSPQVQRLGLAPDAVALPSN
jgi:hypothetical protein